MVQPRVLLADNSEVFLGFIGEFLQEAGFEIAYASNPDRARQILEQEAIALAFFDYRMVDDDESDSSGLKLAIELMGNYSFPIVILTQFGELKYATEALKTRESGRSAAVEFVVKSEGWEKVVETAKRLVNNASIFLSYARDDLLPVETLFDDLVSAGFKPWMDKKNLHGGEPWMAALHKQIDVSDFFIICLSRNSAARRGAVQVELNRGLERMAEKLPDDIYLIPVRLEECEIEDRRLKGLHWIDLFEAEGFQRLVGALREGVSRGVRNR
jgi:CheY-like chemotaxis protein